MKTTVEIEDALLIKAKQRAAGLRKPLRELVEQGLRSQLQASAPTGADRKSIRWVTVPGGLPENLDLADRTAMTRRCGRSL